MHQPSFGERRRQALFQVIDETVGQKLFGWTKDITGLVVEFFCDWPEESGRFCPIQVFEWPEIKCISGEFELCGTFVSWDQSSFRTRTSTLDVDQMESKALCSLASSLEGSFGNDPNFALFGGPETKALIRQTPIPVSAHKNCIQLCMETSDLYKMLGERMSPDTSAEEPPELDSGLKEGDQLFVGARVVSYLDTLFRGGHPFQFHYVKRLAYVACRVEADA